MAIINEIFDFWLNFLYGLTASDGENFESTTAWSSMFDNWTTNGGIAGTQDALGSGFQNFILNFFEFLPHILTFLTLALAVFLFCFMMYKIIKLFTSTF